MKESCIKVSDIAEMTAIVAELFKQGIKVEVDKWDDRQWIIKLVGY